MSREKAIAAWGEMCRNSWDDEKRNYEETFEEEGDAADIETDDLEEHAYKNMRQLDDYLYAEVTFVSIINPSNMFVC